jgi:hypothetical protein
MAKIMSLLFFFFFFNFLNLKNCSPFSVNNYSEQTNEIKRAKTLLLRCPFFSHFAGKFCNSSHSILYISHYLGWLINKIRMLVVP